MPSQFLVDLLILIGVQARCGAKIERTRTTVRVENLTEQELCDLVNYLLANGGNWRTDQESYKKDYDETYHLWLTNRDVHLCCGFVHQGRAINDRGISIPYNYAFRRFIQRG